MSWFHDDSGNSSFTRIAGAVMIIWCMLLFTISVVMKGGTLPSFTEASSLLSILAMALTGKVVQKPFERTKTKEDQ